MKDLVKLAIYGGAAYLVYNYLKGKKTTETASSAQVSTTPVNVAENEEIIVDSAMQQMGEEGMAVAYENQPKLEGLAMESDFGLNNTDSGWDSDNISYGI